MRYMKRILKDNGNWTAVYLAIGLGGAFLSNYKAVCFQKIVDGLTDSTLTVYGILFYGVLLLGYYVLNYLDEYPAAKLGNEIYLDFKLLALEKIGRLDYLEYRKLGTGKLVQRIENGAGAGKGVLYDFWFCVIRNLLPTILFSLYFIRKIDKKITCFLLAGYVVVFLATNLLLKGLYQVKERILANEEELNHFLVRGFMEMPVFRMKNQFAGEIKKAMGAKRVIVSSKVKMTMIHEAFFTIFACLVACLDIGILVYAWRDGSLSVGAVVALITLIDNAYTPVAIFNVIYVQYKLNQTAWRRFTGLLDLKEDGQLTKGTAFPSPFQELRVEKLSFSYHRDSSENKEALKSVSLTIRRGERVAFVGESGSGKSTLVKILAGLLKADRGAVYFDGEPLRNISLESLYERVSYLSQDAPVFDGTVRENLVFDREADQAMLQACLENAGLWPLPGGLDKGLETRIGEKGACLSGGEKQRLALARLWLDAPELIILDEATSALDNVTESLVMKNILEKTGQAAVIAIAHRLASISGFDRIFVFRQGELAGSGTFEELLAEGGYFAELYRKEKARDEKKIKAKGAGAAD